MSTAAATPPVNTKNAPRLGCFVVGQVIGQPVVQEGIGKTSNKPYKFCKFRILAGNQIAEVSQSYAANETPSFPAPGSIASFQILGDFKQHDMVVVKGIYEGPAA